MSKYIKSIPESEIAEWRITKKGLYSEILLAFVKSSDVAMEIELDELRKENPKASALYVGHALRSWKKREDVKKLLESKEIKDIKLVKKSNRVGLIKIR